MMVDADLERHERAPSSTPARPRRARSRPGRRRPRPRSRRPHLTGPGPRHPCPTPLDPQTSGDLRRRRASKRRDVARRCALGDAPRLCALSGLPLPGEAQRGRHLADVLGHADRDPGREVRPPRAARARRPLVSPHPPAGALGPGLAPPRVRGRRRASRERAPRRRAERRDRGRRGARRGGRPDRRRGRDRARALTARRRGRDRRRPLRGPR